MKSTGLWFMAAFIIGVSAVAAFAQDGQAYVDKSGGYKLSLYGDWRAVNYNDAVGRAKTEFVFRHIFSHVTIVTQTKFPNRVLPGNTWRPQCPGRHVHINGRIAEHIRGTALHVQPLEGLQVAHDDLRSWINERFNPAVVIFIDEMVL